MKIFLAVLLLALALAEARRSSRNHTEFMNKHGKKYSSPTEASKRAQIWATHKTKIDSHNALFESGKVTYSMTDNHLADKTVDELVTGLVLPPVSRFASMRLGAELDNRQTPSFLNLTTSPCMAPIKNQAQCGSCWTFAAVNPIEYQYCMKHGNTLVRFSEQQLVACSNSYAPNNGCNGGWPGSAWTYIKDIGGLATEASYPYASASGVSPACTYTASQGVAQVSGWAYIQSDEAAMATAISTYGPITVAVWVNSNYQLYSGGIYNDPTCATVGTNVNHAVTLVGYGNSTCGGAFWIMRNQWGVNWGMKGYMLIARGVNMCNIALWPHVPFVV